MLHNYSCPVARVMVCIGAAAVVRREPSGAKRRTARLLGLMMESLGWLAGLACLPLELCLWNSLSLPLSPSSRCSCMQLVSKTSFPSSLSLSLSRGHYSAGLRRILRYQLSTSPFEVTYHHPLPVGLIPVKEQGGGGRTLLASYYVEFRLFGSVRWVCAIS